jgi:hypothetical protein
MKHYAECISIEMGHGGELTDEVLREADRRLHRLEPAGLKDDEFIVYDQTRDAFVESIDTFDGATEWTADPGQARIFRGSTWREVWTGEDRHLMAPRASPMS